ncbi:hypothetical protein ACQ4PT_071334 [Festuca glaucescens]
MIRPRLTNKKVGTHAISHCTLITTRAHKGRARLRRARAARDARPWRSSARTRPTRARSRRWGSWSSRPPCSATAPRSSTTAPPSPGPRPSAACLRLASALVSLGISRRDVVSVLLPNVPAMYEAHFGVPMSGAVLHSINTRLDARTVAVLLRHSGSKLVFVDPALVPLLDDALCLLQPGHPAPRVVLVEDPHQKDFPPAPATSMTYERLLEMGDPEFAWVRPLSEWDPMVLNYTSGTTAAPKGVVHCHRGIFLVTVGSLVDWAVPPRPTYLWTLPMFHANGWSFPWGMAVVGGTNVCLRRVDAAEVYDTIARRGVTHLCGAPVVLNMLANAPESVRKLLPGKVKIMTAGAPPPAVVLHRAEAMGFEVSHGYGMTETGGHAVSCAWKWSGTSSTRRSVRGSRRGRECAPRA